MKEAIGHKCNAILNIFILNMRCNVKEIESQVSKGRYDPPSQRSKVRKTKTDENKLTIIALGRFGSCSIAATFILVESGHEV